MSNENWTEITHDFKESHFPCWVYATGTKHVHYWRNMHDMKSREPLWTSYTHWMYAAPETLPEPPPEPTLEQKDAQAFRWWRNNTTDDDGVPDVAFAAGIRNERSEIRQLLKRHQSGELPAPEVIREISRRVKL